MNANTILVLIGAAALAWGGQEAKQPEARDRARAARELGRQGSEAIPKLQPLLADPVLEVRLEAVKSLIQIGTQHSIDPLIQATRDNDPEMQIRATDGLVNFYCPGYVETGFSASLRRAGSAIKGRFSDPPELTVGPYVKVRPEVVEALGKVARGGASLEARANAARAVGILRGAQAIPDLLFAMRSKDDQVIYESLVALQKIGEPKAAGEIAYLLRDLNEKVQIAAIETTGLLRNREALPQLEDALARAGSNKVRRAALTAIAMLPDERSRPTFTRYLRDKDDATRAAALEGVGRLKNPGDAAAVERTFNDEKKMRPRLAAAFALVMLGKAEVSEFSPLKYLMNTLNSSAWKGVARAYLVELAREAVVRRSLERAIQGGTREEKIELAQILAVSGDQQTVSYLEKLTADADERVAAEALTAVRTLKARLP